MILRNNYFTFIICYNKGCAMEKNFYYVRMKDTKEKHAGNKAVSDCNTILERAGAKPLYIGSPSNRNRLISKAEKFFQYLNLFSVKKESVVYVQHPMYINTRYMNWIFRMKKIKKVKIVFIIHDIESLRQLFPNEIEKYLYLDNLMADIGDVFIVHNIRMKEYVMKRWKISENNIVNLEIFDYLLDENEEVEEDKKERGIIVAGNLSRQKSGYIYKLKLHNTNLLVYGNGLDEDEKKSYFIYKGAFTPNELPKHLKGEFGLVWDGADITSCLGTVGDYLRYNNPHKVSLYLAAGIPVIIWSEAALSGFIKKHNLGLVIDSLENLEEYVGNVDDKLYDEWKYNAINMSKRLKSGFYLKKAVKEANNKCFN